MIYFGNNFFERAAGKKMLVITVYSLIFDEIFFLPNEL